MSLGVLNNINAIYATNSLNNTSNSLSNVLQQLSSGSKINSGADDAAGLSLVNGLQANSQALTQSTTNATEGVGLLKVADGALSQVTNLLNRAVTLATEVSNGTLNTAQQSAANQEYQSILSEVSNIGQTTTYNQTKVFGAGNVSIYTGDSTSQGASIDQLTVDSLSSSNVGDTNGTMNYTGGSSIFLDLTTGGTNGTAQVGDSLGAASLTSSLDVSYYNSTGTSEAVTISVGSGTAYSNSVSGMIQAINGAGLGITASFGTASQAGATGTASDTGIIITGSAYTLSSATAPSTTNNVMEVTADATHTVKDASTAQAAVAATSTGTKGTAVTSYTASAGADLATTSLTSQANAESALTTLNTAISDISAQDGYIGAQINTLNSVSSVLSTQQENVASAQNAVQATDYASATSALSKYQILSQTGISALAQANSMAQEVTKLLQ